MIFFLNSVNLINLKTPSVGQMQLLELLAACGYKYVKLEGDIFWSDKKYHPIRFYCNQHQHAHEKLQEIILKCGELVDKRCRKYDNSEFKHFIIHILVNFQVLLGFLE